MVLLLLLLTLIFPALIIFIGKSSKDLFSNIHDWNNGKIYEKKVQDYELSQVQKLGDSEKGRLYRGSPTWKQQ